MNFKYPYTDFHELNLDWFLAEFKKLTAEWLQVQHDWEDEQQAFQDLHDYVQDYFANLNLYQEVHDILYSPEMQQTIQLMLSNISASQLPTVVANQIASVVASQIAPVVAAQLPNLLNSMIPSFLPAAVAGEAADWLAAHVDPDTGYVIDDSLSIALAAADAKAVGDQFNIYTTKVRFDISEIENGFYAVADGHFQPSNYWVYSVDYLDENIRRIKTSNTYNLYLEAWDENDVYIGTWFGNGFTTDFDPDYHVKEIDLNYFFVNYPQYKFRFVSTIDGSGSINVSTYISVTEVTKIGKTHSYIDDMCSVFDISLGDILDKKYWSVATIDSEGSFNILNTGDSLYMKRFATKPFMKFTTPITIKPKTGYSMSINIYDLDQNFISQFSRWSSQLYTFNRTDVLYRVVIRANDNSILDFTHLSDYLTKFVRMATSSDRALAEYSNVKTVNHRGYNTEAPENTIPAYELSAIKGYKYVETDVLFTSDGVPVLMHDDTIDRTCCYAADGSAVTGNISIDSVTYSDLITLYDACTPAQYATWAGVKVPTFAEFMATCKKKNLNVWIELKWTHTYTQAEVQRIISIVRQYGMEEHVTFISFSYSALDLVKNEWDSVELGLNGAVADAEALRSGKNRVFMIYNKNNDYSAAVAAGFQVCVYTVDTKADLAALSNPAYDSILTDNLYVSEIYDVLNS